MKILKILSLSIFVSLIVSSCDNQAKPPNQSLYDPNIPIEEQEISFEIEDDKFNKILPNTPEEIKYLITSKEPIKTIAEIKNILINVKKNSYPELKNEEVITKELKSEDVFFQSNFTIKSLFLSKNLKYIIQINDKVIQKKAPKSSIQAILAHELAHTLDYVEGGKLGLIKIGSFFLTSDRTAIYEHRTDLRTIFRGYGEGLIDYREWIYKNIPKKDLEKKKRIYYKPKDIEFIMKSLQKAKLKNKQGILERNWFNNPPMNISEMKQSLKNIGL